MPKLQSAAPCFPVADVGATARWYKEHLGFDFDPFPANEPYQFAVLWRDRVEIMLQRVKDYEKPEVYNRRSGGVWDAYIRMEGVTAFYEQVCETTNIILTLRKQPYGDSEFELKDPNGYILAFSELID
jgi:uncharacterized glyoxalase superfamily protein PhnB